MWALVYASTRKNLGTVVGSALGDRTGRDGLPEQRLEGNIHGAIVVVIMILFTKLRLD